MKTQKSLVMTLLTLILLVMCVSITQAQDTRTLVVFAAASLTDAFEEIATVFEAANPSAEILYNFGSSTDLAIQLSEGAPADVFASANNRQMTVARDAGRIAGSPVTFVRNRLVLILPADNPAGIMTLRDLANPGVRLIVAAPDVPVRDYTETMLDRLAADPAYGEEYRTAVVANIVSEEQNVRQVSAKIALGEGDAGIVYTSDVTPDIASDVIAIPISDYLNTIATYPIAATNDAAEPELAQAFIDFLVSDEGQALLVKWNFITVTIEPVPYVVTLPEANDIVTIDGQVLNPYQLDASTLETLFSPRTLDVTYLSGEDTVNTSFTGALLWQVISQAQPNLNADVRNDRISMFIVVTGSDGYQAVISWAEIDPEFAGQPILLAYEENGAPIADTQGPLRLIVPSDMRGGRYVSGVVNISLRDAPGLGE